MPLLETSFTLPAPYHLRYFDSVHLYIDFGNDWYFDDLYYFPGTATMLPPPSIAGAVYDLQLETSGALVEPPLAGATVELYREGLLEQTTTSASDGAFRFDGLEADGVYELRLRAEGVVPATGETVTVHRIEPGLLPDPEYTFSLPLAMAVAVDVFAALQWLAWRRLPRS